MNTVPYYPLGDDVIKQIIRLQLGRVAKRMRENYKVTYADDVVAHIASRCMEVDSDARIVERAISGPSCPSWPPSSSPGWLPARRLAASRVVSVVLAF